MIISVFDRVKNIVGKGEMLIKAIFSFSTMFSKASLPGRSNGVIVWEWVNMSSADSLNFDQSFGHAPVAQSVAHRT